MTADICRNVRFTHNGVRTIRDNVARITESQQDLTVGVARLPETFHNEQ